MSTVDEPEPPPYARVPQEQRRSPQAAPFCCPWTSSSTARLLAPAPSSAHGGEMTDQLQAGAAPSGRLYDRRRDERDACGIGFVADVNGRASRTILDAGLAGLERLRHRGAVAADARTGDGAGVLLPIPDGIFAASGERVGVAMAFLPRGLEDAKEARRVVEQALVAERLELLHWRAVPVDHQALGELARVTAPTIEQAVFRVVPAGTVAEDAERRCFRAGRRA